MVLKRLIGIVIGGAIGGLLGATRSCETGGCPLTANPYRGALYGAFMGALLVLSFGQAGRGRGPQGAPTPAARAELVRVIGGERASAILVFGATSCGACKTYAPVVEEAEKRLRGRGGKVIHIDVEASPDLARGLDIQALPTTVVIQDGRETERLVGAVSLEKLLSIAPGPEAVPAAPAEES